MADATRADRAAVDRWTEDGQYFEYSKAANPIGRGLITQGAAGRLPPPPPRGGADAGSSRSTSATSSDARARPRAPRSARISSASGAGEQIATPPERHFGAVLRDPRAGAGPVPRRGPPPGAGATSSPSPPGARPSTTPTRTRPSTGSTTSRCCATWASRPTTPRFQPTLYPQERAVTELEKVEQDPEAAKRSRVSVLLANKNFPQTRTITHVIWAMFGVLPAGRGPAARTTTSRSPSTSSSTASRAATR